MRRMLVMSALGGLAGCAVPCADPGTVCTVAGTGSPGLAERITEATASPLYAPQDVEGFPGHGFFIGDWNNHKIRWVEDGEIHTAVGTAFLGDGDPDFEERNAPGISGTLVALNHPTQIEWNPVTERLLVPSWHNHRVREWDPETGNSLVVCANTGVDDGNGANAGFAGDGGPAADALMAFPQSIAVDHDSGDFFLLAQKNKRIRQVAGDFSLIQTIAGSGADGYVGDGGPALEAAFHFWDDADSQPEPAGAVAYDQAGKLYVADSSNHVIRVMDLATGIIDTVAGFPAQTLPGGACDPAALCYPRDVEVGPDGLLWIADTNNHAIRTLDPATGATTVVAGVPGERGASADGDLAAEALLNQPVGIGFDDEGALLIADTHNHRVLRVTP